jgi:hypothetical protein
MNYVQLRLYYKKCLENTCPSCNVLNNCGFGKNVINDNALLVAKKLFEWYIPKSSSEIDALINKCHNRLNIGG